MKKSLAMMLAMSAMMESMAMPIHEYRREEIDEPALERTTIFGYAPRLKGPGRNQRKRRKLARQNPHSRYSK